MKKAFLRSLSITLAVITFLIAVVIIAYAYISDKVLTDNIGDNLSTILDTTKHTLSNNLEADYKRLDDQISVITEGIEDENSVTLVDKKLTALNADKDQITLFNINKLNAGFGGYVEKEGIYMYYINGIYYQDTHALYSNLYEGETFSIFNFGNPEDCKVHDDKQSQFQDEPYVIFKFDDIIVYFKAAEYFNQILNNANIIEYKNIFILYPDGKIKYQSKGTKHGPLYQMLEAEGTQIGIIDDIKKALNAQKETPSDVCISNVRYKEVTCYLLATSLENETYKTDLCIVEILTYTRATTPIKQALAPLVAVFVLMLLIVIISITMNYVFLSRKSNDIDVMVYQRYNDSIYKIKINRNGKILKMNKKFKELLVNYEDYSSINDFIFKETYPDYVIAAITQKPLTIKLSGTHVKTGDTIYIRCVVLRYFGDFIISGVNATAEELQNNNYLNLALYDAATQLPNIQLFKHDIENYIYKINNKKNDGLISLMLIKIKDFHSLYGKFIGDYILKTTKEKLESLIDPRFMTLYYLGDQTFGVSVEGLEKYEEMVDLAKTITKEFTKPVEIDFNQLILNLAFAIYNLDFETFKSEDPEVIYQALVKLVEKVENQTTSNIDVYSLAVERFISSEEVFEQDLRNAIEKKEFEMYLQPQYNVVDKRICGCEMLIRWNNPKYYHQSPAKFIELAERNNLIIPLAKFINEESMRIAKLLEPYNIELSLNVSPVQILQAGFVNELVELAKKYEVNSSLIALEITETFLMENFTAVNEKLKLLQGYGFKIHLDDFCTGYSSMLYLKELPINSIKIDKEFTRFLNTDSYSRAIVNKLAALANSLELDIIVEGVEDEKQLAFLTKNGCNIIQGFLVSKAIPFNALIELIEGVNVTKKIEIISEKKKK